VFVFDLGTNATIWHHIAINVSSNRAVSFTETPEMRHLSENTVGTFLDWLVLRMQFVGSSVLNNASEQDRVGSGSTKPKKQKCRMGFLATNELR
jgi:hypothetical protein